MSKESLLANAQNVKRPRSIFESLLVLLVLLTSSRVFLPEAQQAMLIVATLIAFVSWLLFSRRVPVLMIIYIGAMIIWILWTSASTGAFDLRTTLGHFLRLIFSLLVVAVVGKRGVYLLQRWISVLALIALPLFAFGVIFPSLVAAIYAQLPSFIKTETGNLVNGQLLFAWRRAGLGFYTLSPDRITQNHGFMWEPTAFAFVTVLALSLRILLGKTGLDRANIVLVAATLTTFSSTGYVALFVLIGIWIIIRNPAYSLGLVAIIPVAGVIAVNTDFLLPKIASEFDAGYSASMTWSLSRYASFLRDMTEFAQRPVFGSGIFDAGRPLYNASQPSNNGLSDYLTRYGIAWSLTMLLLVFGSVKTISGSKNLPALLVIFVVVMFGWSEKIFELPIMLMMQLLVLVRQIRWRETTTVRWIA